MDFWGTLVIDSPASDDRYQRHRLAGFDATSLLRAILAGVQPLDCFAHTVFSDEVGVRKPHPEPFVAALRAVGGEAVTTVHVGDDPILDVCGTRAAGLRVVQVVARDAGTPPTTEAPDGTITGLEELPASIAAPEGEHPLA